MRSPSRPIVVCKLPRQFVMSLDPAVSNGMMKPDRNTAIRSLARLLMEAAGADPEEIGDDER
jgi:hypothetical protein